MTTPSSKIKDDLDAVREVVETLNSFKEDEQQRIIKWACEKLGISMECLGKKPSTNIENVAPISVTNQATSSFAKPKDIKSFVESKNPKNDKQFAAVVAYYYQFEAVDKKDSISQKDLVEATRLAVWDRLSRPDQTLVNAANSGLLDKAGTRGQYKLNSVGENLVAMVLPNGEIARAVNKKKKKISKKNKKG